MKTRSCLPQLSRRALNLDRRPVAGVTFTNIVTFTFTLSQETMAGLADNDSLSISSTNSDIDARSTLATVSAIDTQSPEIFRPLRHKRQRSHSTGSFLLPRPPRLVRPTLSGQYTPLYEGSRSSSTITTLSTNGEAGSTDDDASPSSVSSSTLEIRGGAGKPRRLADDEQMSKTLWFFAGGVGPPPTGKKLREWRRREKAAEERKRAKKKAKRARKGNEGGGFWGKAVKALFGAGSPNGDPEKGKAKPAAGSGDAEATATSGSTGDGSGGTGTVTSLVIANPARYTADVAITEI